MATSAKKPTEKSLNSLYIYGYFRSFLRPLTTSIDNINAESNSTVSGLIDFGGGTSAAAGTTMNANDTITGTGNNVSLKVSLQNAGGAIGGVAAVPQVDKLTVAKVTANVQQINDVGVPAGTGGHVVNYTYGALSGSYTCGADAPASATAFVTALNATAGATVAVVGGVTSSATVTTVTGSKDLVLAVAVTGMQVGQVVSGSGIPAGSYITAVTDTTHITISQAATASASPTNFAIPNNVVIKAQTAGTAIPAIQFSAGAGGVAADYPTQSLVVANVTGNQGAVVSFTYNGLAGSYVIGATNDATVANLKAAIDATIPSTQATAAVAGSTGSQYVTVTAVTAGTALSNFSFTGATGNTPTVTITTPNTPASGLSFGNNSGLTALYANNISGQAATIDQTSVASATQLWADRSTNNVSFTNVGKTTTVGINGNGTATQLGNVSASYVADTTTANIAIKGGAKAGTVTVAQADTNLKTVNISSTLGAQTADAGQVNTVGAITLGANATTLNINADSSLVTGGVATANGLTTINAAGLATNVDLGALLSTVKTVNGAGLTAGGITATLSTSAPTDFSFVGGAGTDVVTVTGAFSNTIAGVNGGAGSSDKIILTTKAMTAATGAKFSNFEVLETQVASAVQDASVVTGIQSVIVNAASSGFLKLTAGQAANVTIRENAATAETLSLADATGTSDVLSLNFQNALAANVATNINPGALTINGFESLNVAVNGGKTSIYATGSTGADTQTVSAFTFAASGAADLTTATVTGASALSTTLTNAALLTSFDASANTGGLIVNTGTSATGNLTVKGSSTAANKFTLDTLGTGGKQTIIGGGLTDYILGTQSVVAAATIAGALGVDTLKLSNGGSVTFADVTFKNVTGIEKFAIGTDTGTSSIVAGTYLSGLATAAGGVWDITAGDVTSGAVTIDGSQLTGTNSLKATVTVNAAGASTGAITIYGSTGGADSIKVSTVAGTGSAGNATVNASLNTSAGITIDASGMLDDATSGSTTLLGGSGNDTIKAGAVATLITGGAGSDTVTLGADADKVIYTTKATSIGQANVDNVISFTSTSDKISLTGDGGAGALLNGVTIVTGASSAATFGGNTVSTASVNSIADVYNAIASNADFAASVFLASTGVAGHLESKTISFASGAAQGTYLIVNDGVAGFQGANDLVVQIGTVGVTSFATGDLTVV